MTPGRMVDTLVFASIATSLISFGAWLTHVVACVDKAEWGFLIAGAIAFPVGVAHGVGIWFGIW